MRAYKEKQFLVFDFGNGKDVKYDLSTGRMIGKKGNPVKGLTGQLRGYRIQDVIDSFEDAKYKQFLNFVYRASGHDSYYYNAGTFLSKIKPMSRFEQFFSAGVTNVAPSLKYHITNIPKDLIRLSKEKEFILTDEAVGQYKAHKDIIRNIYEMDFTSITNQDIYRYILCADRCSNYSEHFTNLINTHKYHYETLMRYIDNLMTYEALDGFYNVLRELNDYANMMSKLSNKFEKYPKHFLTTHKIAARNFNRLKQGFKEELFSKIREEKMECTIGEYTFIYPTSTQDIKDEAVQQQNCLASYIQKVLDGECHIIFMRKKDAPKDTLVTLEIKGLNVVQAKGQYNRETTELEQEVISKYNEKLLKIYGGKKHVA